MSEGTDPEGRFARPFLRLLVISIAVAAGLAGVGYLPTRALAGESGVFGMLVGTGIALTGTVVGLVPPLLMLRADSRQRHSGILAGMVVRFLLTVGLLTAAMLAGFCDRVPLALWAVIGYIILLVVDVVALGALMKRDSRMSP